MGIAYVNCRDYYIPGLALPEEKRNCPAAEMQRVSPELLRRQENWRN